MARLPVGLVRDSYGDLCGTLSAAALARLSVGELLAAGEDNAVELRSTLRANLHTGQPDDKMQLDALTIIVGFQNAKGASLVVGVADDGGVLGLASDAFPNEDKMALYPGNLACDRLG